MVLVIVGILTGFAVLGLGNRASELVNDEAQRLNLVLAAAREESLLEGRNYGLGFWQAGYAFYELREGDWTGLGGDAMLGVHEWDETIEAALLLEGIEIAMRREPPERPQIFIFASGEMTPFELRLQQADNPETERVLQLDQLGRQLDAAR